MSALPPASSTRIPIPRASWIPGARQVNCLFGLALNGYAELNHESLRLDRSVRLPRDWLELLHADGQQSAGRSAAAGSDGRLGRHPQRQPGRAAAGAHADGSLEGAAITVLAKGVNFPVESVGNGRRHFPDRHDSAHRRAPAATTGCGPNTASGSQPVPEQLPVQPVAHRRLGHHQQFAGRRRHLRARLGA